MSDASGVSRRGIVSGLGLMTLAPWLLAASPGTVPRPAAAPLDTRRFRDFIRLRTAPDLAPPRRRPMAVFFGSSTKPATTAIRRPVDPRTRC
jgi:hypothetical protein